MPDIERRALKVILALCDLERKDLAERLGYERRYVNNVLCGVTRPSPAFCRAFGDTIAELVFGDRCRPGRLLPTAPLLEMVRRRARYAARKRDFYSDNGINMNYLSSREFVSEAVVDRICSALGVHPSSLYGADADTERAS